MKNIMKNKYFLLGLILMIGFGIGWVFKPSGTKEVSISAHDHAEISENQTWTCSMHPQIQKSEPGDCPICGMELVPMKNDKDSGIDPDAIAMSATAMQLAQVETMKVGRGIAEKAVRLDGKIQADERLVYTQPSHIPGRIEKLFLNFEGEFVKKGQIIAKIYSPDLVTAQEELFEALKIKETQPQLFKATINKLKNWKLTDYQIDKIITSKKIVENFPIVANVSGYVTEKMINLGDYVNEGKPLYKIADLSRVWVLFDLYESDLAWIKNGMPVTYTVSSIPSQSFEGVVSYIDPVINPKTRVTKARVVAANPKMQLKPEMFVSGTIQAAAQNTQESIVVPKTAVMWTGKRSVVYVMEKTDQQVSFKMRQVNLGSELNQGYEIESGLEVGEDIAINGTFSIDAAAQLSGKPSMMSPEGGAAMTGHSGMDMGDQNMDDN